MTLTFSFDIDADIEEFIDSPDDEFNSFQVSKSKEGYYFEDEPDVLSREELSETLYALLAYLDIEQENQHILEAGYASMDSDIRNAIDERDCTIPFSVWLRTVIYPILRR